MIPFIVILAPDTHSSVLFLFSWGVKYLSYATMAS